MKLGRLIRAAGEHVGLREGDVIRIEAQYSMDRTIISSLNDEIIANADIGIRRIVDNATISIFVFENNYGFNPLDILSVGLDNIKNSNFDIPFYTFLGRYRFDDVRRIPSEHYGVFKKDLKVGKTKKNDNRIISENLKLVIPNDEYIKNIINVFEYLPIKINGNYGWYDKKNNRIVTIIKESVKNKIRPWIVSIKNNIKIYKPEEIGLSEKDIIQYFHGHNLKICEFQVINYIDSGKIFKFTNEKKEVVGKKFEALQIDLDFKSKNSDVPINTIVLKLPTGNRRFVLSDVKIIYPNINGYCESKDRTIKPGVKVKVINDKHTIFKKNELVVVNDVKKVGSKKYAVFAINENTVKLYNINKFKTI